MAETTRVYPRRNRQGILLKNGQHEAAITFMQKNLFVRRMWEKAQKPFWQIINSARRQ